MCLDLTLSFWSLSIAGKTYNASSGNYAGFLTGGENYTSFWEALQNDRGIWTVKVSDPPGTGQDSWQFTFSVA